MEDNLSVLVDAKTEYTKQLTNILVPFIYEGIKSIYDETVDYCVVNDDKSVLMRFQEKLSLIPKWSQEILGQEYSRITNSSGCDWLDELVTAVFLSHTKILTAIKKNGKKQKKINLKIPKIDHFIHKCYIECAREFWRNPYLYSDKCSQSEYQRNVRESQKIISNTIEETIRKLLPVKNILREYLGEEEGESDKDTSFISDSHRDNLRKLVKKEIEICQGKNDLTLNGPSDNELITEESENLEKQEEEAIKEIISTELYEKDLTKDNEKDDETDNVIDLDDIEEISLALNNKIESKMAEENIDSGMDNITETSSFSQEPVLENAENTTVTLEESINSTLEENVKPVSDSIEEINISEESVDNVSDNIVEGVNADSAKVEESVNTVQESLEENVEQSTSNVDSNSDIVKSSLESNNVEQLISNDTSNDEKPNNSEDSIGTFEEEKNLESNLSDYSEDELDISKLDLKKMDISSLNIEEINFDNDDFDFNLSNESLVEINEDNNLKLEDSETTTQIETPTEPEVREAKPPEIKKIVIDDKNTNLKKYTKDVKKNFSFFD